MTSTNSLYTRAQPSAPSSTLTVPAQMDEFSPGQNASDVGTDLQRLQRNVSRPLNALLDSANGPGTPVTFALPSSALHASMNAMVYGIPLLQVTAVTALAVCATGSIAGTGTLNVAGIVAPIALTPHTAQLSVPARVSGALPITAVTTSAWSFTGTIYVTVYMRPVAS